MKKIFLFALVALLSLVARSGYAETIIQPGGVAFIQWDTRTTGAGQFAFLARQPIEAGTKIYITNGNWTGTGFSTTVTNQGIIEILFNEDISFGQVVKVSYANGTLAATTGIVSLSSSFDFGNDPQGDLDKLYAYQSVDNGVSLATTANGNYPGKVITAVFYNYKSSKTAHTLPPGVVFQNNANANSSGTLTTAIDWAANGANFKCACWTPYAAPSNTPTDLPLSSLVVTNELVNLHSAFYDKNLWVSNSNGNAVTLSNGPISPCDPTTVFTWLGNPNNITYDKYRYGYFIGSEPGNSTSESGTVLRWQALASTANATWVNMAPANFIEATRDKEVQFYQNYSFGDVSNANISAITTTFRESIEFGKLIIKNTTTVTLAANVDLKVHTAVTMDNSASLYLRSDLSTLTNQIFYAQISPTSATLNGNYIYDLLFTKSGWHHLYSPISTPLNSVQFTNTSGSIISSLFNYSTGNVNVYYWDPAYTNSTFWQIANGSLNFSDRPYTMYFDDDQVPFRMKVYGGLKYIDQNATITKEAQYYNPGSSSGVGPGYNAQWIEVESYNGYRDGWNFYGNPYLSNLDFFNMHAAYGDLTPDMMLTALVWDPVGQGALNENNYFYYSSLSGTSGTNQIDGSISDERAEIISPFQAYFTRMDGVSNTYSNGQVINNGAIFSKKVRKSGHSLTVSKKTAGVADKIGLKIAQSGQGYMGAHIQVAQSAIVQQNQLTRSDVPYLGFGFVDLALVVDSSLFTMKVVPSIQDSSRQKVLAASNVQNQPLVIANMDDFDPHFESFIYDRKLGMLHNLAYSAYSFQNDTNFRDYRFEWFVVSNGLSMDETQFKPSTYWFTQNDALRIGGSMATDAPASLTLYTWDGRKAASAEGRGNEVAIPVAGLAKGPYVMIVNGKTALKVVVQ